MCRLKYKLKHHKDAEKDRERILAYIVQEFDMPGAAHRLNIAFNKGFQKIRRQPYICPVIEFDTPKAHEYRRLLVQNYIAVYWIDEDNKIITVSRIFHSRQDYANKIKE
jgi:addiction module RelE/StbE family toxin